MVANQYTTDTSSSPRQETISHNFEHSLFVPMASTVPIQRGVLLMLSEGINHLLLRVLFSACYLEL